MFPVKREDVCHRLVLQSSRSIEEAFFSVESAGVGYHRLFLTRNIRVSEANMPTSTNMQSSTHLFLLVVVLVMVLKPLPHPGSPPTEDVMQKRGREKKRRRKEFKAKRRPVQDCQKNQHVWTKWHSSGQDVVFFIRLWHVASSAVAWQESAQRRKVKEFGSSASKSWKISWGNICSDCAHSDFYLCVDSLQTTWNLNFNFIVDSRFHFGVTILLYLSEFSPFSHHHLFPAALSVQSSSSLSKSHTRRAKCTQANFRYPEWKRIPVSYGKFWMKGGVNLV